MRVKVRTIRSTNDGRIVSDETEEYREETELNWQKAGYKLRRNAKGHKVRSMYGPSYYVYTEKEVLPMTERELDRYKKKQRAARHEYDQLRKERIKEEEEAARREEEARLQTAWQWLRYEKRAPIDGAQAVPKTYSSWDTPDDSQTWYYYAKKDTRPLTDEEYQKLHDSYVEKFGGWAEIDLAHTTYDGHKWW